MQKGVSTEGLVEEPICPCRGPYLRFLFWIVLFNYFGQEQAAAEVELAGSVLSFLLLA